MSKHTPKLSKEERQRMERLSVKLARAEAGLKRAKSRMVRSFGAWQRAELLLTRTIKAIERPIESEARLGGAVHNPAWQDDAPQAIK